VALNTIKKQEILRDFPTGKTTDTLATFSTRHRRKTNKEINTTKKNEKMGNKDQTKEWPRTMVLVKVKDFLYLLWTEISC
jgi:hypothetical protein